MPAEALHDQRSHDGFRVGFCVSGAGRLCRAALAMRDALGVVPAIVIADEKAAADLPEDCATHVTPFVRLDARDRAAFDSALSLHVLGAQLDLLVLTFDRLIPAALLDGLAAPVINVHMSLLPAFQGFRATHRALSAGVRFVGASIHEVVAEADAGPPVSQCLTVVRPEDDEADIGTRLFARLLPMYLQTIAWYAEGRVERGGDGRIWVRGASYDEGLVSPDVETRIVDLARAARPSRLASL
ncbi:MAG: phosphoribosylglycinamide formyltransferase [Gemmatimonadaceae bacterium]|nr:phosphoribosylglycinamide formyltransferase [Gemmatimonadaceae bacterium]